jgi:glycerol-3-phosphate dehydrogenase
LTNVHYDSSYLQILSAEDNRIYPMDASIFVNAAGPWAGEVAKMAGIGVSGEYPVALPVEPR